MSDSNTPSNPENGSKADRKSGDGEGADGEKQQEDVISEKLSLDWLGIAPILVLGVELTVLLVSIYLGNETLMQMGSNVGGVVRGMYEASGLGMIVSVFGPVITIAILIGVFNGICGLVIAGTKIDREQEEEQEESLDEDGTGPISTFKRRVGYGIGALLDTFSTGEEGPDSPIAIDENNTDQQVADGGKSTTASNGGTEIAKANGGSTQAEEGGDGDDANLPATPETTQSPDTPSIAERSAAYSMVSDWVNGEDSSTADTDDIDLEEKDTEIIDRATERVQSREGGMSIEALKEEVATIEKEQAKSDVEGRTGAIDTAEERKEAERLAVAPEEIEENKTYLTRTGRDGETKYSQTLIISNYPSRVAPGWLDEFFTKGLDTESANIGISYHIAPRDTSNMLDTLGVRVTRLLMGINEKKEKGKTNVHEEQQQLEQVKRLRNALSKGETKMYDFSLYLEVTADEKERLQEGAKEIKNHLGRVAGQATPLYDRQLDAQRSMAPLGTDAVRNTQIMDLDAMGTTFPFVDPALVQPAGVLMGFHQTTSTPVVVNRFEQSGHNMLISGKIGSGKSYLAKLCMWRRLIMDPTVEMLIIDPVGGFGSTVNSVGGQQVTINSDTIINPMEIREVDADDAKELESNPYEDKLRSLMGMFASEFKGKKELDKREEGVLRRAIRLAYLSQGITTELETHSNQSPTIQKVLDILDDLSAGKRPEEFLDVPQEFENLIESYSGMGGGTDENTKNAASSVKYGLEMFREGGARSNLNGQTSVKLQDRIVQFDISNIADGSSETLYMHIILDWLFQRAKSNEGRTVVNIDEAHYMLGQPQALNMLNLFARHSRHYTTGLTLISQTVDEFMNSEQAKEIYDQCDIRALMRHEDLGSEATKALGLTQRDINFVLQAQAGNSANYSETLLYATDGGKMRLNIKSNGFEHHVVEEDLNAWAYAYENDMIVDEQISDKRKETIQRVLERKEKREAVAD